MCYQGFIRLISISPYLNKLSYQYIITNFASRKVGEIMAYSKELVAQLTKQIIDDLDDKVRQMVLDVEKRKKSNKMMNLLKGR